MRPLIRPLLSRVVLALAICAAAAGLTRADDASGAPPATAEAPQRVLVLLRMPPEHAGPGAGAGSYGDQAGSAARRRIASRLAQKHGLVLVDSWPMPLLGVDCYIMEAPPGRSADEAAQSLSREPGVAGAQVSHAFRGEGAAVAHDDPLFLAQPAAREWRLADLHELATGRDVRVAVIDSMVDLTQPDLVGQVQVSRNFVPDRPALPEDHGTGVAGLIAARADNGVGIVGIAPHARLMALRACWESPSGPARTTGTICDTLSLARALHFAIDHHAQVINLSLGGPDDVLLGQLIDAAELRGIKVVAAYDRKAPGGGFPASHPGVIAVADEPLAPLPTGVYTAPGRDVPTTQPGGRWLLVSGSSYAAAQVSGLLALVIERRPLEPKALSLVAARSGGGIDACASLLRVWRRDDCACARAR
jgi:hypothetical protein